MSISLLVLRGGALGDFVITLPALAALRRRWPDAKLTFVGNAAAAELGRAQGLIDTICSQHESRWSALYSDDELPSEFGRWLATFDVVVNFWPDPDGDLQRHFPLRDRQQFVTAPAIPIRAPAAAHYCDALRPLGIETNEYFFRFNSDHPRAAAHAASDARPLAIHPGSGSRSKNWPAERWVELIGILPAPVVIVLGEAEADQWQALNAHRRALSEWMDTGRVRVAANLPLAELAGLIGECRGFIGHDSGVSHLAAASGTSCVLLFGPTDPAMWAPPAPHVRVIRKGEELAGISVADVRTALTGLGM